MTRTILLTGATGGLGQALVEELTQEPTHFILVGRKEPILKELKDTFTSDTVTVDYIVCDLSKEQDRQMCLNALPEQIDIIIHNAGYGIFEEAHLFTDNTVEHMFSVNILSPIVLTNALLPKLYKQGKGHIIFVASQASKMATPKSSIYSATKFGLRGYANALRLEAKKHGIFVTTVNPGPIDTGFFDIADKTGQYQKAVANTMLTAKDVARKISRRIFRPTREINLPFSMAVAAVLYEVLPTVSDRLVLKLFNKK
ncbi:SDR family NAD(P)-dependent oxidoreductase [Granulicatella sp. zg-ZJ]|uniref:SDR family NAD(P)-dependent oxidoreductase n=1 Tax=unclassified Granulicatella TaxID=2630493 RepID=UPI0013C09B35|nr:MULTISPECIES: SDR family oxidoreductase [unclassified Granulicatella]MBS4749548.1 SDR family oxidoreductase [Carnobacteriaceae bacterium zg-ZUI78]NEW62691.1 SDR family NAD(P)-dependent oxidoreductase [Granulicatella sp. zg-ZJ]NEW65740.1 SDR family NAD(P)-dependent oxidoreductase [Granulicatella sp. zg-84]QMI86507.1 SDR family oxidoreductase [Carnobacteriaceae bacterium zg-84]